MHTLYNRLRRSLRGLCIEKYLHKNPNTALYDKVNTTAIIKPLSLSHKHSNQTRVCQMQR